MATIRISNLQVTGFDLFDDDENYLSELSDDEISDIRGGMVQVFTQNPTEGYACTNCIPSLNLPISKTLKI